MLDTGARRIVLESAYNPHYLPSGHLVFQRDKGILIAPFEAKTLKLTGPAVPLIDEIRRDGLASDGSVAQFAISRNGTLAYVPGEEVTRNLGTVNQAGTFTPLSLAADRFSIPRVSPNGQYVAVEIGGLQSGPSEIFIRDLARETTTKLTQEGADAWPAWRPNNRELAVFSVKKNAATGIYLKDLSGTERLLLTADTGVGLRPGSWSPDGMLLAYTVQNSGQDHIWILTMSEKPTAKPLLNTAASEHSPGFSPDGRWLAYVSDESGREEVYVRRFPDGDKVVVSNSGGNGPVWNPNGKEIFYQANIDGKPKLMAVAVTPEGGTLRFGTPRPVLDMRVPASTGGLDQYSISNNFGPSYDIFPDGQRFVMVRGADPQGAREIVLLQNWFSELQQRVPVK